MQSLSAFYIKFSKLLNTIVTQLHTGVDSMPVKKITRLNTGGTLGLSIPIAICKRMGLSADDFVNISIVGNTLHITKVVMT